MCVIYYFKGIEFTYHLGIYVENIVNAERKKLKHEWIVWLFCFLFSLCSSAGVQFGDNQARDVLAVMGMEMTKHAFVQLITEKASKSLHDAPVFLKKV